MCCACLRREQQNRVNDKRELANSSVPTCRIVIKNIKEEFMKSSTCNFIQWPTRCKGKKDELMRWEIKGQHNEIHCGVEPKLSASARKV